MILRVMCGFTIVFFMAVIIWLIGHNVHYRSDLRDIEVQVDILKIEIKDLRSDIIDVKAGHYFDYGCN